MWPVVWFVYSGLWHGRERRGQPRAAVVGAARSVTPTLLKWVREGLGVFLLILRSGILLWEKVEEPRYRTRLLMLIAAFSPERC